MDPRISNNSYYTFLPTFNPLFEDEIKSEARHSQAQMSNRSAKAAILLLSLNRQLRSLNNHRHQSEVVKLKRDVEDLKIELVREKVKRKKMDRMHIWMEFLYLQISFQLLTIILCFVFFTD